MTVTSSSPFGAVRGSQMGPPRDGLSLLLSLWIFSRRPQRWRQGGNQALASLLTGQVVDSGLGLEASVSALETHEGLPMGLCMGSLGLPQAW